MRNELQRRLVVLFGCMKPSKFGRTWSPGHVLVGSGPSFNPTSNGRSRFRENRNSSL
jgi:hypothetical protein